MPYQLYYTLDKNLQSTDLKKIEKEEVISSIEKMNQESKDACYLLIYEHYRITENKETKTPYGAVITGNDIQFDLSNMPIKLRRILYNFCKISRG